MNTQLKKCGNACTDSVCEYINKYYTCNHYCCRRTIILIDYCITCGNNQKSNIKINLPNRCRCQQKLEDDTSKMCNNCEDDNMYEEDKYGFDEDDSETIARRNINNYSYKQK